MKSTWVPWREISWNTIIMKLKAGELLYDSPQRQRVDESMRVAFLSAFPEEDWERYQSELESTRVVFMKSTWDVIRRYGTQSVMRVGLNHPMRCEVMGKLMKLTESNGLTESVTEESAEESPVMRDQPVKRTKKGLRIYKSMVRKLKSRVNDKVTSPKVVKSEAAAVVISLAESSSPV